jgi:pimeloyl-ACP methyl ester carboxylesterase
MVLPRDEAGSGPAVVLLHAGVADRSMWAEHLQPLAAAGRRVLAPDLPGFGEAPAPAVQAPWQDVLETMSAAGVAEAVLVGNSFGAAVALRVAAVAPERVPALVLVSSPPEDGEPSPALAEAWEAEEAALEAGDIEAAVDAVVSAWTLPEAPSALRERVAAMQRRAFELQAGAEPEPAEDPLEADAGALSACRAPALVAVGEHDMPDFHQAAQELERGLGDCRGRVTIARAGHLAPLEAPEEFRELVLGFLENV